MNCKHSDFYARDKTCNAGKVCKELFDSYSYDQRISEPTRFSGNRQSCIDFYLLILLIFLIKLERNHLFLAAIRFL